AIVSPATVRLAERESFLLQCRRELAGKFGQEKEYDVDQIDWLEDIDMQRPIRAKKQLIAIRDFMLDDVELLTAQMQGNIDNASEEFKRFEEAKRLVVPVMKSRGCSWGKAVEYLRVGGFI